MNVSQVKHLNEPLKLLGQLRVACSRIAPVWPLESFVAVNPYMGLLEQDFAEAARRLRQVGGARMTMPTRFYVDAFDSGTFHLEDVAKALADAGDSTDAKTFIDAARAAARQTSEPQASVPNVADQAASLTGKTWGRLVTERVSAWAAAYFDEGQAEWAPDHDEGSLFGAWRAEAILDRTPEIMGIRGFRATVAALPESPLEAASQALARLQVPEEGLELYLHRLLMRVGGWSAYAARVVWDRRLYEQVEDDTLVQFLCVLLCWEVAILDAFEAQGLREAWSKARAGLADMVGASGRDDDLERNLVLHAAYEHASRREMVNRINRKSPHLAKTDASERPRVQAVFCIDVRSEVYRRHLEAVDASIETLGFAGFFAFPIEFVPLGHERGRMQCPVLLTPGARVMEGMPNAETEAAAVHGRRVAHEVKRAWQAFKMGAVSCFSFVGPIGLAYLPKLFTDGFGWTRPVPHPDDESLDRDAIHAKTARLEPAQHQGMSSGIPLDTRVELAAGALGAMSLTKNYARLVMITGHGSTTVNNPHATGLDCGACGGQTGEANARVAASVLNDPQVRMALVDRGIEVPDDTFFLACQHDTTTDMVTIFNRTEVPDSHAQDLADLETALEQAGKACRAERAGRLYLGSGRSVDDAVMARSRDWAQVRPEWGLAGCSAFIVAPRHRTEGLNFEGRSFLHSYAWEQDDGFGVLELIMTAPMVVASWISLQYYASTVDNRLFGSGNKTLHNVVGTVGVFEGNAGDLRVGLPWQSVHDGTSLQHDPVRLNVMIEAPTEAMNAVIAKHEMVRHLLDNGWLHLYAMDGSGRLSHEYRGSFEWSRIDEGQSSIRADASPASLAL
ncbi:MAG: YbcC family protein [Myxococcota bacterium]